MDEKKRVNNASNWYLQGQLDFDKRLIGFRYKTWKPFLQGPDGLELGPAEGQMTRFFVNDFVRLTAVDAALELLNIIPDYPNLLKVHSLFEDFKPQQLYNTIILEHILEHVEYPIQLIRDASKWLAPKGRLLLGVPNGNSFHRLAAVKMGLLHHQCELTPRDLVLGHRRVYIHETFRKDIESSGVHVMEMGGVFFKPLSNQQIQDHWSEEMLNGFYELGRDFPENAAEIYAVCELP